MVKFTKIVCTIGPVSSSAKAIESMIAAGMDVARLNFSHGTHEEHLERIRTIRKVSQQMGRHIAILQDLPGPKLRVGKMIGEPVKLVEGSHVVLTTRNVGGNSEVIPVQLEELPHAVDRDTLIYLADGVIRLRVEEVVEDGVRCVVELGGLLSTGKGVNIPGMSAKISAVTQQDKEHLRFGVENGVDYIALSFVRTPEDVRTGKKLVSEMGSDTPIIAKIEKSEAVVKFKEIISEADAIMVARGDLGVELGLENVPMVQKKIIRESNLNGKPVITATQILISMLKDPTPTRAEVSDIANAIIDGTDALMLSEETAVGKYYVESVQVLSRVSQTVEKELVFDPRHVLTADSIEDAVGRAACQVAHAVNAKIILAYTRSGSTARLISKNRPRIPIAAFTPSDEVVTRLNLVWGVEPHYVPESVGAIMPDEVDKKLSEFKLAMSGEKVVVVAGVPTGPVGSTNMIRVQSIK
jgi:pyruvate kinase